MPSLFEEYIAESPDVLPFFAGAARALFAAAPAAGPWDSALVDEIRAYQAQLGGNTSFAGSEAVIVTGQQAGLFTGPLYTVYKAATAVLLARRIEAATGTACLPLFWVSSDDHDFEEVRTARFLTKKQETLSLRYTPGTKSTETPVDWGGCPVHRIPASGELHDFIGKAAAETPGSEFRDEVAAALHQTLDESDSVAAWFARLIAWLFRDTPLVVFMPHLAAARKAAARVVLREIQEPLASTRLLNEAGQRLEALGFSPQVVKNEKECCFFLEVDGRRRKVLFEEGLYRLPEEGAAFPREELAALVQSEPERFSPNVALRCVVQQALFPAAAYVAGPGEIAYWAQLKPLFAHFGYPMPTVYPRARCVLTTTKLKRLMKKFGFSMDDLSLPQADLEERALRLVSRGPVSAIVQQRRGEIETALGALEQDLAALKKNGEPLRDMAQGLSGHVTAGLDRFERAARRGDKAQVEATRNQVRRLCTALAPERKPQERFYSVFSFLFAQGPEFIPCLLERLDIESFDMNEVEL